MRTRIVYYSRTGATRLLAEALGARMVAEVTEIGCDRYGTGVLGYLRAGRDVLGGKRPDIRVAGAAEPYDCLVVGSPIWAGRLSTPVARFLAGLSDRPERIGVFVTSGGEGPHPTARDEARGLIGRAPDAWLSLSGAEVRAGAHMDALEDFLRDLAHAG